MSAAEKRADLIAAGCNPVPGPRTLALSYRLDVPSGPQALKSHCLCLRWTAEDGTIYETCCECWYVDGEAYSVAAKRPRKARRA